MSGIIGVSPDMRSGVVGVLPQKNPGFMAYLTGHHGSTAASSTYTWKDDSYALTVAYDNGGCFTKSSGRFFPKVKGIYHILANVTIDNINDAGRVITMLYDQNDTNITYRTVHSGKSQALSCELNAIREFNGSSDEVEIRFYFESSASETLLGTQGHSIFSASRVG